MFSQVVCPLASAAPALYFSLESVSYAPTPTSINIAPPIFMINDSRFGRGSYTTWANRIYKWSGLRNRSCGTICGFDTRGSSFMLYLPWYVECVIAERFGRTGSLNDINHSIAGQQGVITCETDDEAYAMDLNSLDWRESRGQIFFVISWFKTNSPSAIDRVICSYTPTIKGPSYARERSHKSAIERNQNASRQRHQSQVICPSQDARSKNWHTLCNHSFKQTDVVQDSTRDTVL